MTHDRSPYQVLSLELTKVFTGHGKQLWPGLTSSITIGWHVSTPEISGNAGNSGFIIIIAKVITIFQQGEVDRCYKVSY